MSQFLAVKGDRGWGLRRRPGPLSLSLLRERGWDARKTPQFYSSKRIEKILLTKLRNEFRLVPDLRPRASYIAHFACKNVHTETASNSDAKPKNPSTLYSGKGAGAKVWKDVGTILGRELWWRAQFIVSCSKAKECHAPRPRKEGIMGNCMKGVWLDSVELVRKAAVELATIATNGSPMVGNPMHEWVTEGRRKQYEIALKKGATWARNMQKHGGYSSCGDLAHWLLMMLGCRDEGIVNRGDDGGVKGWAVGSNLSRLVISPWFIRFVRQKEDLLPGDIVLLGPPEHATVLLCHQTQVGNPDGVWITADYGQPYGARRRKILQVDRLGGRKIIGFLSLSRLFWQDGLTVPACVPDDFVGGKPGPLDVQVPDGIELSLS